MKFVIQRVLQGSVIVNEKIVGEIGPGLVVLVGFTHSDKKENLKFAANKLLSMRLWDDAKGTRWKECLKDRKNGLLVVPQFTLYSVLKGYSPSYHKAMDPKNAVVFYEEFLNILKQIYEPEKVQSGIFAEMMQVSLINDGPITINWEYPEMPDKDDISESNRYTLVEKESYLNLKELREKDVIVGNNKKNDNKNKNKSKASNKKNLREKKEDIFETEKDLDLLKIKDEDKFDEGKNNNSIKNETYNTNNPEGKAEFIKLPEDIK